MKFSSKHRDEPEINLIPFIDVLLVVLIFLMLTTTYSRFTALQVNLPVADAEQPAQQTAEVVVSIGQDGRYAVNRRVLEQASVSGLIAALKEAAGPADKTIVVINADAAASHQSVVNVMDAARRSGLSQITFATQAATGP
ncbi:MAG: hypothetical protein RL323_1414 [Pseudomonadota bacterium]|jgi:biopolymer transport protein ExbD